MKKVLIWTVIIISIVAFIMGATIAWRLGYLNTFKQFLSQKTFPAAPPPLTLLSLPLKPITSLPSGMTLNLSSPDDNQLVFDENILLQGKTTPGSLILISFESSDLALEPSPSGEFSTTVYMDEGVNQFTVTAINKDGDLKQEERTVYYSKEKL
ncbi:MAG: hypothetical protein UU73_C0003G0108 [Candidatus Daviesbacteria bacterium GW2011_GWA1_41_61]|uniref:Bacterial Ig-like domain-containing protein n=1 Tax=Candidatus Daviesbacteria bacterium GW2011_GWA2_40_9 TaxID=1618424 RepID=A0A0G0U283_9BACT|nr:MAG: hypothetical protein UU26_C0003G0118 [Candidatus Daviesbacteria bacterium GW2011_GWC1_40_9]KKR83194.1 MAG: hypothetical protein UU29_C0007G0064 [Candidatus Daviesbacteria bacterium GW2011_GWA2_40_9]KKR93541.1 MAG: hypothetical protein UU44_C0002G0202 [Candidatus Daviesbacteria bacterium GW2011_GWB1_41_15]KKS14909.1 MAG: hypothetical protein UU73_C0003G0108 [Candidatus Daviesbacteria bacterium GW2011_GWA1_41_61]